jgi:hypothetical protein
MQINMYDLKVITNRLLEWVITEHNQELDVPDHFYWDIPADQLYSLDHEPTTFDVGQLSDDWLELRKLLDNQRVPIRQQFVWLASLFRALGEGDT